MFGFLKPHPAPDGYRTAYARLCQHHRLHHGLRASMAHSYEAVFLFTLAGDLGLYERDALPASGCCRLRCLPQPVPEDESRVGEFCARLGMLLASVKLEDDAADDRSLAARLASHWWSRPIRETRQYFAGLDNSFATTMEAIFARQAEIEFRPPTEVAWPEAVEPTSEAFGYVFSLLSKATGRDDLRDLLHGVGVDLGSAIVAFDMVADLEKDQRQGAYNPLKSASEHEVRNAARAAVTGIVSAQERIDAALPGSISGRILVRIMEQSRAFLDPATGGGVSPGSDSACDLGVREQGLVYSDVGGCLCLCLGLLACGSMCNTGRTVVFEKDCSGNTTARPKRPCEC